MQPTELSAIIFFCIFSGVMLGTYLCAAISEHHLNAKTKELVKLGVGLMVQWRHCAVFWITTLFASFGLFAPPNGTEIVTLLIAAISVAGALFLILELDHQFSGLIQISSVPLRSAVLLLGK